RAGPDRRDRKSPRGNGSRASRRAHAVSSLSDAVIFLAVYIRHAPGALRPSTLVARFEDHVVLQFRGRAGLRDGGIPHSALPSLSDEREAVLEEDSGDQFAAQGG